MRVLVLFLFLLGWVQLSTAQQLKVTGVVTDTSGQPLVGVTVREAATKNGTVSREDGSFALTLTNNAATLNFSYIGYAPRKLQAQSGRMKVVLQHDAKSRLDEVVVIGAQQQSRRLTTASYSTVTAQQIENLPAASVDALLQGRVAGMNVQITSGEPGVAPTVVVRGNSRVNTNIGNSPNVAQAQAMSGPLYVIDGFPVNPEDIANSSEDANGNTNITGTNYLAGININDIESVDVQKDAAATAAWGSRGANGVIYIKTRKGKSGKPEFRVNAYDGFTQQPQLLKTYTGDAERRLKMDLIRQYASPSQLLALPHILVDSLNPNFNNNTDWQGLFYRNGAVRNGDVTMSGASEIANYRLSGNYYDEKGIIEQFGYKRYALRGNFGFNISPKLSAQLIVSLSKGDRQRGRKVNNSDDNTPFSGKDQPASFYRLTAFDSANFSGLYSKLRNVNTDNYYSASFALTYHILPWLNYSFQGSGNVTSTNKDYFVPSNVDAIAAMDPDADAQPSYAESDQSKYSTYFMSNSVTASRRFGQHNFVLTAGQQFNTDESTGNSVAGYNVPNNDIHVVSGIPQSDLAGFSYYKKDALLSLMGQLQYDYKRKYLLYGSYRGDASSRFGANSKWGYFPAIGAGWIVSEEPFMKGEQLSKVVSLLKLRASWGISGSQSQDFYAPYNSYEVSGTYGGSTAIQPSYTNGLTKNDLTWSKTEQKNIGIDLSLLDSRINVTVDAYDKISKDDYYNFNLPFYTGFQSVMFNAHDLWVSNRGADITINTHNLSPRSKFQWNSQLVFTYNKNAIAKLPNNNRTFVVDDWYGVSRLYAVGQPIYRMFQMQYQGVYNKAGDIPFNKLTGNPLTYFKGNHKVSPGDPIWKDVNGDGDVWSDEDNGDQYGDRVATGDPNPRFTGGFTNDFSYKNFSLSVVCTFTWKRTVVNTFYQQQMDAIGGNINNFAERRLPNLDGVNYWSPTKAGADPDYKANFPAINPFSGYFYQFFPFSDMWNVDGSYFKVKSVIAGYSLPQQLVKPLKLKSIRFYSVLDNLVIIKNKKNTMPDPEAVDQLGIYTGGLFPQAKKYTLGVDVQF